jgi:hypothetical protein
MKRFGFIAAIVLIGAAAAAISWWRYPFAKAAKPAATTSLSAEVRSLRDEVAALRREPTPLQQTLLNYANPTPSQQPAAPPAAALESDEEKMERMERRAQAAAESLDRRLLTEARDVAWGNESVTKASETLARVPGATLLSSTCASTVCRVVMTQGSNDEQRSLGNTISSSPPFDQGTLYRYDYASVPPRTTLYVIREGHDLAELTGNDLALVQ